MVEQQPPQSPPPNQPEPPDDITGIESNRLLAAVSYLFALALIPLFVHRNDPFVIFHAKHGLILLIAYVVAAIAVAWAPVLGSALWLFLMLISIAGFIQTIQGKRWHIPFITPLTKKFNI